jgi:uncharacterized protein (DUF2062 family)
VVFKRRTQRTWRVAVSEFFYPRGGWRRAASYVMHRLRRLPDAPHRIARGIAAGTFISFTPLFGFHFMGAALIALLLRGNVIASLMGTFFGNPISFPFIAAASLETGRWLLGIPSEGMLLPDVLTAFGQATLQLWHNAEALFGPQEMHWDSLARFYRRIFLPYLLGSLIPGTIAAVAMHYISLPLINAYQTLRRKKLHARLERRILERRAKSDRAGPAPGHRR